MHGKDPRHSSPARCQGIGESRISIARQGKHIVMTDGVRIVTIPRHDPADAYTMGGIVRDAGVTPEQFRKLL